MAKKVAKRTRASAPPASPEGIRIGTLANGGPNAADYISQILPYGFESFSLMFWQSLGGVDLAKLAARMNNVLSGSGAVISSLGMFGVKQFVPIINPPECAILAAASVEPRVVPLPDGIGTRDMMTLTLACDHRAVDGADAAGLLGEIKNNLQRILDFQEQWV